MSSIHPACSGVGGGVVSQPYFQSHFGILNVDGSVNKGKSNDISANVVSVLQAGAFFGAIASAPLSSAIGRRWTLFGFTVFFAIGAVGPVEAHISLSLALMFAPFRFFKLSQVAHEV